MSTLRRVVIGVCVLFIALSVGFAVADAINGDPLMALFDVIAAALWTWMLIGKLQPRPRR
jgi:hypothetical protein